MEYLPREKFVLRSPLFSLNVLKALYHNDYQKIQSILKSDLFKESVFFASPFLYELIAEDVNFVEKLSNNEKLRLTFTKYLIRMCSRPVPFGQFAGCVLGTLGTKDLLVRNTARPYISHIRADMYLVHALANMLSENLELQRVSSFSINPTVLLEDGRLKYFKSNLNFETFQINTAFYSLESNPILDRILMHGGLLSFDDLMIICHDEGVPKLFGIEFIHSLIDNQILVNQLFPAASDIDPLNTLSEKLIQMGPIPEVNSEAILKLNDYFQKIHESYTGENLKFLEFVRDSIKKDFEKIYKEGGSFQCDLELKYDLCELNKRHFENITEGLSLLTRLKTSKSSVLNRFRQKFLERYGDKEIPLLQALDRDIGISLFGHNSFGQDIDDLLTDVQISRIGDQKISDSESLTESSSFVLKKYVEQLAASHKAIEIYDHDLENLPAKEDHFIYTPFSTIVEVVEVNNQKLIYLKEINLGSATSLIGRFSYYNDSFRDHLKEVAAEEDQIHADKLSAEILHFPNIKISNIVLRDTFRDFEIPIISGPSNAGKEAIPLSDLYISIKNQRIILKSKKLGKEILPKLSNAHNFLKQDSLPVYTFLSLLEYEGTASNLKFPNATLTKLFGHSPRFVYKNIILSPETWVLKPADLDVLDSQHLLAYLQLIKCPKYVYLNQGSNNLLINISHPDSLKILLQHLSKTSIILQESYISDENFKDNNYVNEFVVNFLPSGK